VAQKSDAKITAMGEYTYAIATTGADTGKGFSVGKVTKVEKKGTITITNYWDNTRGMNNAASGLSNYNKAITVLAVRIPAGATVAVSAPAAGVEANVVGLEYGTLGLNTVDGLVDAYVTIEYSTIGDTTFTLTVNYDDGPNDGVKGYTGFSRSWDVKTTWVVRTSADPDTTNAASVAYNKFTSTLGKTLTPAAAVMPSNPNEAQVKSSSPSVAPTSTPSATSTPAMGNPFNAIAYIITIGASAIGGISTLVIRKRK
ncbi:MAG TPA: hypothetical protein PKH29_12620, partial [Oscillospiraceae bacterium]|nr:hypothetical protein [Oscillospiraceae bacterium]